MARNVSYIHDYYDIRDYDVFREMSGQHLEDLSIALLQRILNNEGSVFVPLQMNLIEIRICH